MSAVLYNLNDDGTLEILMPKGSVKNIVRVTLEEPGRKPEKTFQPATLESKWELNPHRLTCEHFRCKKCHYINCEATKYCGECGAKMKNEGVRWEDLPLAPFENEL